MVRREAVVEVGRAEGVRWGIRVALVLMVVAASTLASANETGPILGFTGAPGEFPDGANCTYGPGQGCHESFAANSGPGSVTIDVPDGYEPGLTYTITVNVAQAGQLRWGFQMTVLDALHQPAGTSVPTDTNAQLQDFSTFTERQYISHTIGGTAADRPNGNSWTIDWTAPETNVGKVTFWAAGNAANNDVMSEGDYIYTTFETIQAPEPGALAAGLVALSAAAALARRPSRRPR